MKPCPLGLLGCDFCLEKYTCLLVLQLIAKDFLANFSTDMAAFSGLLALSPVKHVNLIY